MSPSSRASGPRVVLADNPGPFTFQGTCTWILGAERAAVVDPGPDSAPHRAAVLEALEGAAEVAVLLTHGHRDHSEGAARLAAELGTEVRGYGAGARPFAPGEVTETDAGELVPVDTPGHSREHSVFHWPAGRGVFTGDLILGEGDTTWVAEYPGCVADYLASLNRVEALGATRLFPGHGPVLEDAAAAVERFRAHRLVRIDQVRQARVLHPTADADSLLDAVYGDTVPAGLRGAALQSLGAVLDYLDHH